MGKAREFSSVKVTKQVTGQLQVTTQLYYNSINQVLINGMALSTTGSNYACYRQQQLFGLSLCAGAGGLDLGLQLAIPGYRTVGYIERESYAAATIVARMEDQTLDYAPIWDDVTTFEGKPWRGMVDIIHGGYPCQPFSVAGKQLGDKDERHLWPHVARVVNEIKPQFCFFENVGGHLRLGFEQVHDDLYGMGYQVKAGLFTAEEVGASHKRERLFILAYRDSNGFQNQACSATRKDDTQGWAECFTDTGLSGNSDSACQLPLQQRRFGKSTNGQTLPESECSLANTACMGIEQHKRRSRHLFKRSRQSLANTDGAGLERWVFNEKPSMQPQRPFPPSPSDDAGWRDYLANWPRLEPAVCGSVDGLAYRVDRLRLCGNGVIPLVAAYAFRTLATAANLNFEIP